MSRRITQSGDLTTDNIVVSNKVTGRILIGGEQLAVANTAPSIDTTVSLGKTVFVKNDIKKLIVKGTTKSDYYDVSNVSTDESVLVNNNGMLEGANAITHNKQTGAFNVGGRMSFGKLTVSGHARDGQLLYSNAGTLEGAPISYDNTLEQTTVTGKLKITGGLTVLGNVSQIKVENVVIDDPILEISSNSENNTTSGVVMQRPNGNVAISYQPDDTLNLSYTNGSAYDTELTVDTSKNLPVKIQGTLDISGDTVLRSNLSVSGDGTAVTVTRINFL